MSTDHEDAVPAPDVHAPGPSITASGARDVLTDPTLWSAAGAAAVTGIRQIGSTRRVRIREEQETARESVRQVGETAREEIRHRER